MYYPGHKSTKSVVYSKSVTADMQALVSVSAAVSVALSSVIFAHEF